MGYSILVKNQSKKNMKKVIIKINEDGFKITVKIHGQKFIEKHVKSTSLQNKITGSKCIQGNFEHVGEIDKELLAAIENAPFQILRALNN